MNVANAFINFYIDYINNILYIFYITQPSRSSTDSSAGVQIRGYCRY
jgi:hypothetical protein